MLSSEIIHHLTGLKYGWYLSSVYGMLIIVMALNIGLPWYHFRYLRSTITNHK